MNFEGTTEHILNKNVPDFGLIFANTVKRRELITCDNVTKPCPSSDERPLLATTMAISKRNTSNAGFFRNGADLAVVVLSDEDEGSDGTNATLPSQVMSSVTQAFGPNKTFSVYGILIEPMDSACWNLQQNNSGQYGHHAYQLAELTGGVTGSICDNDYGPTLTSIGNRVRDMVKTITLRYVPDPDRLQLILTPFDSSVTWELEGKIIRFNKPPKKGSQATVVYLPKK